MKPFYNLPKASSMHDGEPPKLSEYNNLLLNVCLAFYRLRTYPPIDPESFVEFRSHDSKRQLTRTSAFASSASVARTVQHQPSLNKLAHHGPANTPEC
ncbi:hypothetical protein JCM33374_g2489 [Metschnikowia sp. JCM 33374]|nr:hypothetical protein JCM33374_g2489 [Metschnikowia sp. JCM 33374]